MRFSALCQTIFLVFIFSCGGDDPPATNDPPATHFTERPAPWSQPHPAPRPNAIDPDAPTLPSNLSAFRLGNAHLDNPAYDGWDSEAISNLMHKRIKEVVHELEVASNDTHLGAFVGSRFTATDLRPDHLETVYESPQLVVQRAETPPSDRPHRGLPGLQAALTDLATVVRGLDDVRAAAKTHRFNEVGSPDGNGEAREFTTQVHVSLSGRSETQSSECNAEWLVTWAYDGKLAELLGIQVLEYEENRLTAKALFSDVTASLFANEKSLFEEQLTPSIHPWLHRIDISIEPDFEGMQGLAIADVNGDDLDDVYVCQGGGLPNRLLLQQADGTVRDVSAEAGVDFLETTRSALWFDYDNDQDPDLVLATDAGLVLLENDGKAHFTIHSQWPDIALAFSLSAADYDLDGDLDLYVSRYFPASNKSVGQLPNPVPYHDANNGGANVLLRNDDGHFQDATAAVGLSANNQRWSYACAWEDYDNDGDSDLYVANDFGRNNLYRNENGRFQDVAEAAGVEDIASGMSVTWGDYDRDGHMDLYVSNMFSSAGGRITFQRQFKHDASSQTKSHYQRLARGNSLFRNLGNGGFVDVSEEADVTMGRWAWGSKFADINNDGWEDLLVTNGYVTGEDSGDL